MEIGNRKRLEETVKKAWLPQYGTGTMHYFYFLFIFGE